MVVLPPLVVAELISGTHRLRDRAGLIDLLNELLLHETPLLHWIRVGELRSHCRQKGFSISTPDAHVAQCALDLDALLLSRDAVFSRVSRVSNLRVSPGR